MPQLLGPSVRVVAFGGITIDEFAGNVATASDTLSIARVAVAAPAAEPWLTLDYDEWICVIKGRVELHAPGGDVVVGNAGETLFIARGERFQPVFPEKDTEYIPVCIPAFKPERCVREEDGISEVSARLAALHAGKTPPAAAPASSSAAAAAPAEKHADIERLYHMCERARWDAAVSARAAYFPPTFEEDGRFTHATGVPSRLIATANHFYKASKGDWVCVELSRSALREKCGLVTLFEEAKPVGATGPGAVAGAGYVPWVFPHVYGGLPTGVEGVVTNTFPMKRDEDGTFLSIVGIAE